MDLQNGNGSKSVDVVLKNLPSPSPMSSNTSAPQGSSAVAEDIERNMDILKDIGSPSPIPSNTTDDSSMNVTNEEVLQKARSVKERRRAVRINKMIKKRLHKSHKRLAIYDKERKLIQEQKEAINEEIRAIDEKLETLHNRERSALLSLERYQDIVNRIQELEDNYEHADEQELELCFKDLEELVDD